VLAQLLLRVVAKRHHPSYTLVSEIQLCPIKVMVIVVLFTHFDLLPVVLRGE
jgi:hypothetical protein